MALGCEARKEEEGGTFWKGLQRAIQKGTLVLSTPATEQVV